MDLAHGDPVGRPRPARAVGRRTRRGRVVHRRPARDVRRRGRPGGLGRVPARSSAATGRTPTRRRGTRALDSAGWTSTASTPQVLYPNVAMFNAGSIREIAERTTSSWPWCGRTTTTRRTSAARDPEPSARRHVAAVLGPRRDVGRDRALRGGTGTRASCSRRTRARSDCPSSTDRYWDRMWASAQEKGLPVNFHIASGDMTLLDNAGHPDNGAHANYASMGVVVLHGQRPHDRAADLRRHLPPLPEAELRVGGERHRLVAVRARRARLAVAQLRCGARAPGVRAPAERVLQAPDLRLLLVRAGHRATRPSSSSGRTTSSTRRTSRTRRACRPGPPSAADDPEGLHRRDVRRAPRRRRPARSSTTTRHASTTWIDARAPVGVEGAAITEERRARARRDRHAARVAGRGGARR